uniref:ubinuclein-1 n=1 Tax=Monopterus albus TaxID=43700 RepID=UPI0009B30220|nr:ubinuclein-1 [Monopterus albus]XP_020443044.1 ubinuclein-1 [Monopterus albus]
MAESRRVDLTTLNCGLHSSSSQLSSVQRSRSGGLCPADKFPGSPADTDTVRLVLSLFDPDERSFPEFSYTQLVDNKISDSKDKAPLSRYEEGRENDEVVAIAKKLEKKYGRSLKKKDRIQDLIDIGYGYDEEDSFIDNSEAYDEFVPASITTKFGGFYVNSGVLQFRQASDCDTETEDLRTEEKTLKPSKKRHHSGGQDKPKKWCREDGERKTNMESRSSILSGISLAHEMKKKKRTVGTLSVTRMLKKFQREKEKKQKMEKANLKAAVIMDGPTIPRCPADAAGGGGLGLTEPLLSLIGSTNDHTLIQAASTVDFDIDLDSLLDVTEASLPESLPQPAAETQLFKPTDDRGQLNVSAEAQTPKMNLQPKAHSEQIQLLSEASSASSHQCVPLPEGLPPGLEENIRKLMVAARTSEGGSKLKFFTPEINSILLDIELQCRERGSHLRSKVYTHTSSFLPCSRETLLKRVKKLLLTHMEGPPDTEDPMQRLKEAVSRAMSEQTERYHEKCQVYEQVKASKATEEGKQKMNVVAEDNVEERSGKRGPKKLFKWNEEIRECLCHVLGPKMDKYKKEGKGSQETEEYLKTLLDNEVKPLWPKGWMQSRALLRESRKLGFFTSLPVKKARSDKKQPFISGASAVLDALQGTPPVKEQLSQETEDVLIEGSGVTTSMSLGAVLKEAEVLKKGEGKKAGGVVVAMCSSTSAVSEDPLVSATSAPTRSLLELLADHTLAQEQTLSVPQELLAAAVPNYRHSVQHWSFGSDPRGSPFFPPAPQSSPIEFPVSGVCHDVLPQLLQSQHFARLIDAGHLQILADEVDNAIQ